MTGPGHGAAAPWWREAVVYQVYVRSFADSDGDGLGDLPGIASRLPYLAALGVDAVWLTPFYPSPLADGGYDVADYCDVDPRLGTLADLDLLVSEAHRHGLRLILDLVPNHCSDQHAWFQEALTAGPGSPARARFHFRPLDPADPDRVPNDWPANFGGPAWARASEPGGGAEEWYLHLFAPEQPDFNWDNPEVRVKFEEILRFWLDRGVDGFRIDVAHGLVKAAGLPALGPELLARMLANKLDPTLVDPVWDQPGVHDVYRDWRRILDSYADDRMAVGEVWLGNPAALARYIRPDELHQAFNFRWLFTMWDAAALRQVVTESLAEVATVGASATWVLSNHDVWRPPSRYGGGALGLARARAMATFMHALPGSSYVYQGEELGLPEVTDLPEDALRDPIWERSGHTIRGRDGARVPIPWSGTAPPYGFGPEGTQPWLPQPEVWAELSVAAQDGVPGSTLALFREVLRLRRTLLVGSGPIAWLDDLPSDVIGFRRGRVVVLLNLGAVAAALPRSIDATVLGVSSDPHHTEGSLPASTCAWYLTG